MAERTRKLHVTYQPRGVYDDAPFVIVACEWHVGETRERLLSSRDATARNALAVEIFRPGDPRAAHWRRRSTDVRLDVDTGAFPADIARAAFYALSEPDVGAIHVVDAMRVERTFIRDRPDWLDVPRFAHPTYAVAPRAA